MSSWHFENRRDDFGRTLQQFFLSFFFSRELLTVYVSDSPDRDSSIQIVWSYWTALAANLVDSDVPLGSMRLEGPAEIQAMREKLIVI